jgi:RimJ/RimL family protein N-acetyltransferase
MNVEALASAAGPTPTGVELRPFGRDGFDRLIGWIDSPEALRDWAAIFFDYPLTVPQLEEYLREAEAGRKRLFVALDAGSGRAIGHIELSHILPHLSAFVSRVLIGEPAFRGRGYGTRLVETFVRYAFAEFGFHRLDLGVLPTNARAIHCYEKLGFRYVGTWPDGLKKGNVALTVNWMTLFRADWDNRVSERGCRLRGLQFQGTVVVPVSALEPEREHPVGQPVEQSVGLFDDLLLGLSEKVTLEFLPAEVVGQPTPQVMLPVRREGPRRRLFPLLPAGVQRVALGLGGGPFTLQVSQARVRVRQLGGDVCRIPSLLWQERFFLGPKTFALLAEGSQSGLCMLERRPPLSSLAVSQPAQFSAPPIEFMALGRADCSCPCGREPAQRVVAAPGGGVRTRLLSGQADPSPLLLLAEFLCPFAERSHGIRRLSSVFADLLQ